MILSVVIITPPADSYLHGGLNSGWSNQLDIRHLLRSIGRLFSSYFLIVPKQKWLDLSICASIALFIFVLTLIKLSKKPFSIFFYVIGNSIILTFTYLRFAGGPRHFGHLYLVLIAALWLGSHYQESTFLVKKFFIKEKFWQLCQKWQHIAFMLILYAHLLGGIYSYAREFIIPFSASRETANYIQKSQLAQEFIVASRDANMAAVSGYLNRKLYYPELQNMGSFTLFKQSRKPVEQAEILEQVNSLLTSQKDKNKILLLLHKQLKLTHNNLKIVPIKNFERAWVDSERYYLYWVSKAVSQ